MSDNTNDPEVTPNDPAMTPPQDAMPDSGQNTRGPSAGSDGAEAIGSGGEAGEKRNDGSDPIPHRGELEQHAAGAGEPGATADGRQTAAGTADSSAEVMTPDQVLSAVEIRPAASVGPVIPGRAGGRGGRGGGGGSGGGRDSRGGGGGGRGGDRRGGRGGRDEPDESGIESSVIRIYRCSKVVKGGRTFSFAALVVAGDRNGQLGIGYGKANEVPSAVEKATKEARKTMFNFPMKGSTIPHMIIGKSGASQVKLIPALPGTGVTAGKTVRPVLELAGLTDVLTKAYGSTSPKNLLKATIDALRRLQSTEQVAGRRGVKLEAGAGELVESVA